MAGPGAEGLPVSRMTPWVVSLRIPPAWQSPTKPPWAGCRESGGKWGKLTQSDRTFVVQGKLLHTITNCVNKIVGKKVM